MAYRRILITVTWVALSCTEATSAPALTPNQKRLNIESFELIWSTIRDQYWDPDFGGVNWQAVHDELRPKIEGAASMSDARAVMSDMMDRLGKSHFGLIPAEVYEDLDAKGGEGTAGLEVRILDGRAIVTSVEEGSPAASEGVHAGWEIRRVEGTALAPSLDKISAHYRDATTQELYLARSVLAKLSGDPGSAVHVEFLDGARRRVSKTLTRIQPQGTPAKFGYLPTIHVWFRTSRPAEDTGYIAFNFFLDPAHLMTEFGDALGKCAACPGVVIDLRGNPGGLGIMALGMAGWFIEKPDQRLGTMHMRQAPIKFTVNPRRPAYRGRVAMLVDACSASTSEIFAGGMKDLGRARIFGTRTAGAALPSAIDRLPNGDAFQHAIADYVSEGGRPLEGIGVIPDVEVKLTREALLAGRDPVLEAAIEWIHARR